MAEKARILKISKPKLEPMSKLIGNPLSLKFPAVAIFGAGATRGAFPRSELPPPVDRDFFEIAGQISGRGTRDVARRVLKSVWEIYGRAHSIGLEEYYREVETRARIGSFAKTRNQPKDWIRRRQDLEELIRRVYIHTTADLSMSPAQPHQSPTHERLLRLLKSRSTIITFNYDMVIEEAFSKTGSWNPRDGFGVEIRGVSHEWTRRWYATSKIGEHEKSRVTLLKLHGSLGWVQYSNHQLKMKDRPYSVRKGFSDKISILAPGWNKPIDRNPYKDLWRQARLKLEACKSLFVLGYSLPDTDLLARALFSEVVRLRKHRTEYLENLFLIDLSHEVKERLAKLFTPALGPYGKIFRFSSFEEFGSMLERRKL